jgi:hypothetical protein
MMVSGRPQSQGSDALTPGTPAIDSPYSAESASNSPELALASAEKSDDGFAAEGARVLKPVQRQVKGRRKGSGQNSGESAKEAAGISEDEDDAGMSEWNPTLVCVCTCVCMFL